MCNLSPSESLSSASLRVQGRNSNCDKGTEAQNILTMVQYVSGPGCESSLGLDFHGLWYLTPRNANHTLKPFQETQCKECWLINYCLLIVFIHLYQLEILMIIIMYWYTVGWRDQLGFNQNPFLWNSLYSGSDHHLGLLRSSVQLIVCTRAHSSNHLLFICTGAQIIDLMILVVDVVKGMQTQTAECLVIGEITCDHMIVVLNKVDLIPPEKREAHVEKVQTER